MLDGWRAHSQISMPNPNPPGSCSKPGLARATKNGSRATFYAHAIKSQNAPQTHTASIGGAGTQLPMPMDGRLTFISISNGQRSCQRRTPLQATGLGRLLRQPPGAGSWMLDANWIDPRRHRQAAAGTR